ncbi:hypothetical protein HK097_002132 [Rhizophlyctis rosea]|uniref:Uncharacterized protein n=1 Tax=Rhizophlyctis rosea TaxID=64517 RepID=A0AAD5SFN1_9FUNG|nr:hypothetical protein HK097_002132 [Rhizophlyctis rosea]
MALQLPHASTLTSRLGNPNPPSQNPRYSQPNEGNTAFETFATNRFEVLNNAAEVTLERFKRTGLKEPLVVERMEESGMEMPDRTLTRLRKKLHGTGGDLKWNKGSVGVFIRVGEFVAVEGGVVGFNDVRKLLILGVRVAFADIAEVSVSQAGKWYQEGRRRLNARFYAGLFSGE